MISRLRGTVVARTAAGLVLDVGGVGYRLRDSARDRAGGEEATVDTYLVVREDALQLYGFASTDERELFRLLLGVSTSSGRRVALAIVSRVDTCRAAPRDRTRRHRAEAIPGIGRKTAQRVIMELKEKLAGGRC